MEYYKRPVTLSIHRISNKFLRKSVKWSSHERLFDKSNRLLLADGAFLSLQLHVDERLAQNSMCMRSLFVFSLFLWLTLSLLFQQYYLFSLFLWSGCSFYFDYAPHIYINAVHNGGTCSTCARYFLISGERRERDSNRSPNALWTNGVVHIVHSNCVKIYCIFFSLCFLFLARLANELCENQKRENIFFIISSYEYESVECLTYGDNAQSLYFITEFHIFVRSSHTRHNY